jgi:hypothetical protein
LGLWRRLPAAANAGAAHTLNKTSNESRKRILNEIAIT